MARQSIFRKNKSYVAVRPIRMGKKVIQPGDSVDHLRLFHLRDLHRRRRIGAEGEEWTRAMLQNRAGRARPENSAIKRDKPKQIVPGASDPFMHQNGEGQWVLGDGQVFETLDDALEAWHNPIDTESLDDSDDEPDETGNADLSEQQTEPDETTDSGEPPEPVKVGSQWTIEGVEGKFTSKKKATEAWAAAQFDPLES